MAICYTLHQGNPLLDTEECLIHLPSPPIKYINVSLFLISGPVVSETSSKRGVPK